MSHSQLYGKKKKRRFELTLGFFSYKAEQDELPRTKRLFNEIANLFSLLQTPTDKLRSVIRESYGFQQFNEETSKDMKVNYMSKNFQINLGIAAKTLYEKKILPSKGILHLR